jgi:hypothetical protein
MKADICPVHPCEPVNSNDPSSGNSPDEEGREAEEITYLFTLFIN